MKLIGIRLPDEKVTQLQKLADEDCRNRSDYARLVLCKHIDEKTQDLP